MSVFKRSALVLLLLLSGPTQPSQVSNEECRELQAFGGKSRSALHGYFGCYRQDLTGYPVAPTDLDIVSAFSGSVLRLFEYQFQATFRFMTADIRPFAFVQHNDDGSQFVVWGPAYSVFVEVASKLNRSLDGIALREEDIIFAFFQYMPTFGMFPFGPQTSLMALWFIENPICQWLSAWIPPLTQCLSRVLGEKENRCIAYQWRAKRRAAQLFAVFDVTDRYGWTALALSTVAMATALTLTNRVTRNVLVNSLAALESLFGARLRSRYRFPALGLLWLTSLWLLQQLYGGEMFERMNQPPQPDVIDSWDDLARAKHLKIAVVTDSMRLSENPLMGQVYKGLSYFSKSSPYYADFNSRHYLVDMLYYYNHDLIPLGDDHVIETNRLDGDAVLMFECGALRYRYAALLGDRPLVHVSASGGSVLPYFVGRNAGGTQAELDAMNDCVARLTESGIYQKWVLVAIYNFKEAKVRALNFGFERFSVSHMRGPVMVAFVGFAIGFTCFLFENYRFFIRLLLSVLIASLVATKSLKQYMMHQVRDILYKLRSLLH